jgi:hypothetical protein
MTGETVIGVFSRDRLNPALAAVHRAGFGAHARVLDGTRGDLATQWRRANLAADMAQLDLAADDVLVLINAPGRSTVAASTLARVDARAVWRLDRATLTRHDTAPNVLPPAADLPSPRPITDSYQALQPPRSAVPVAKSGETQHTEAAGSN